MDFFKDAQSDFKIKLLEFGTDCCGLHNLVCKYGGNDFLESPRGQIHYHLSGFLTGLNFYSPSWICIFYLVDVQWGIKVEQSGQDALCFSNNDDNDYYKDYDDGMKNQMAWYM